MSRKSVRLIVLFLMMATLSFGVLLPAPEPVQADGGSYSINYAAADPDMYIPPIPYPGLVTPIEGRGNGNVKIPNAHFQQPGGGDVRVKALEPSEMALGQIVPFEVKITVSGSTEPEGGCITFVGGWSTETTSNMLFGYDESYGVYAAFIDTSDGAHNDLHEDAEVTSFTHAVVDNEIQGTFNICGLDSGDTVVMEIWMVLDSTLPDKVTGNVPSRAIKAYTDHYLCTFTAS